MSENRIKNLEEMLAHQELQLGDLSDMLILQSREIAKMQKHILRLEAKIEASASEQNSDEAPLSPLEQAARDKPPHY